VDTGVFAVGIGMVGPTLMVHGTSAQQERYLRPLLRGGEVWCQLFSEPGAGSDLAGLRTRAERDGDEWVVNGQKVWSSGAHHSDLGILLARTDPDAPKHRGITYFVVDMRTSGIDVRPLRQITGVAHFNEVFLTDVRIPHENVVGEVNGGWAVAHTTLGNERTLIGGGTQIGFGDFRRLAEEQGRVDDPIMRQRLAAAFSRFEILKYLGQRAQAASRQGKPPGPESSVLKLAVSRHVSLNGDLALALERADGMLIHDDAPYGGYWQQQFLGQWGVRIGGGTDQVQRNVIGERVLGLPAEPRPDKSVPFRELMGN
jgi:alkylation response protein AidB-like acyl-CoA dehydrogenase